MWRTKPYADIFAGMKVLHMACRRFADFKLGALQCEHSETHDPSSPCFLFLSGYCYLFRQRSYNRGRKVNHQSLHSLFFSRHWSYVNGKCAENVANASWDRTSIVLLRRTYSSSCTELQHNGKCSINVNVCTVVLFTPVQLSSWYIWKLTRFLTLNFLNHQKQLLKMFTITLANLIL